jgi:hypothetical protein
MSPLEFMQRLTALMPRLRLHAQMTAARPSIFTVTRAIWVGSVSSAHDVEGRQCAVSFR